jgi:peptidoglycan/xylan/chitin deacetylase (PgdA/CDA1 family)
MSCYVPILLYHDLESHSCPNEKLNAAAMDTVVDFDRFKSQIEYLSKNGYKTITLDEYFTFRNQNKVISSKSIIISFDDGHYSNYRLALPVLVKYGYKAVFFIVADRVGTAHHLTETQIKEMVDHGMEIGSHGVTHKYLPLMGWSEIKAEISDSKKKLEYYSGQTIQFFGFPGGHYNRHSLKLLKKTGYTGACSCLQGLNSLKTNPFLLKRIEIRKKCTIDEFKNTFNTANIAFYYFIDLWKHFVRNLIGLKTYTNLRKRFYKYYIFKR